MSDIVERLREGVFGSDTTKTDAFLHSLTHEAADEIERLRAALKGLVSGIRFAKVENLMPVRFEVAIYALGEKD
jgi:hypothetical protein